jgi:DNA-directed RNA polymerase specialized sigma24 family protein
MESISLKANSADILLQKLKRLSREERILLGLYFYEGLTIQEIVEVLHWDTFKIQSMLENLFPDVNFFNENSWEPENVFAAFSG